MGPLDRSSINRSINPLIKLHMKDFLTIATIVLSMVNAGLCALSENWTGACGWAVATISTIELLEK